MNSETKLIDEVLNKVFLGTQCLIHANKRFIPFQDQDVARVVNVGPKILSQKVTLKTAFSYSKQVFLK